MSKIVTIRRDGTWPHLNVISVPFDQNVVDISRTVPGMTYGKKVDQSYRKSEYVLAEEMTEEILGCLKAGGYQVFDNRKERSKPSKVKITGGVGYQNHAAAWLVKNNGGLLSLEMGMGKTYTSILAMQAMHKKRILVICPASAISVWEHELDTRWPTHPEIFTPTSGNDDMPVDNHILRIVITSYGMLNPDWGCNADCVVLDESHYIKNAKSTRREACMQTIWNAPNATRIALTGTPIDDKIPDLWGQLDWLHPWRWGTYYDFCGRYCNKESIKVGKDKYVTKFEGLNEETQGELMKRIEHVAVRVTKDQVNWKKDIEADIHMLESSSGVTNLKGSKTVSREQIYAAHLASSTVERVNTSVNKVLVSRKEERKTVILTYLRKTAAEIVDALPDSVLVTGEMTPRKRQEAIQEAWDGEGRSTIVATLSSVKEAINTLAEAEYVVFAEATYHLAAMEQVIARFSRLGTATNTFIEFLVQPGTVDELILYGLRRKIEDHDSVMALSSIAHTLRQIRISTVGLADRLTSYESVDDMLEDLI